MGKKVNVEDLIDARAVALILGLKHANSVSTYAKRYADFPSPVVNLGRGRTLLWLRGDVVTWSARRGREKH
ncbi:MAG: hypothetical protein U0V56_06755 [Actinomycetota bacterium]